MQLGRFRIRNLPFAALLLLLLLGPSVTPAAAQQAAAPEAAGSVAEKIDELRKLLADPDVQAALTQAGAEPAAPAPPTSALSREVAAESAIDHWLGRLGGHFWAVIGAARDLPGDLARAGHRALELIGEAGWLRFLLPLVITLGGAFGVEAICAWALRKDAHATPPEAIAAPDPIPAAEVEPLSPADPLAVEIVPPDVVAPAAPVAEAPPASLRQFGRIADKALPLAAFVLTLIVLHTLMRGPGQLGPLLRPWLVALVVIRVVRVLVRFSFTLPDASDLPEIRDFWLRRLTLIVAVMMGGGALSRSAAVLGAPMDCVILLRYLTGFALILLTILTIWRHPETAEQSQAAHRKRLMLTVWLVLIGLLELVGAMLIFWLAVYAVALPPLLRQVTRFVRGMSPSYAEPGGGHALRTVLADRGSRAVVLIGATAWLVWFLKHDPAGRFLDSESMGVVINGALRGVIILLLADLAWHLLSAKVSDSIATSAAAHDPAALARTARMRTLLPIFRSVAGAAILVIAAMMVLAGMGVEIGPLIAGAGIFGVAIGFGSQTLVKDVISGVFYMIDDAFRVGEYIQSGSYKGVVEGFSLRSVRLRHHRGPVYTVPFGSLGAVQNMSRDWSKDKFLLNVPFNTDVELVRKLVKKVGQTLLDDPELGPLFIQPIKMKGVEQFTDYGMTLAVAMILHPTPLLTTIRRRAYKMIHEAFRENGIEFASPTVQVAGHGNDDDPGADEAAALAMERKRRAAEAAKAAGA